MASYGPLLTPMAACMMIRPVSSSIEYRWRGPVSDAEMMTLVTAHGGQAVPGWWDQIRPCSLGWVTARLPGGGLAGFVNVAWRPGVFTAQLGECGGDIPGCLAFVCSLAWL